MDLFLVYITRAWRVSDKGNGIRPLASNGTTVTVSGTGIGLIVVLVLYIRSYMKVSGLTSGN